jgi:hypothetical protein
LTKTYGDADFDITDPITNSTGLFSYTSSNVNVATIVGNTVTIVGAGTATITATISSDSDYDVATTTALLTVDKAIPNLEILAGINKTFEDADFDITNPTSNSTGAITLSSSDVNVATISYCRSRNGNDNRFAGRRCKLFIKYNNNVTNCR